MPTTLKSLNSSKIVDFSHSGFSPVFTFDDSLSTFQDRIGIIGEAKMRLSGKDKGG
jgi:hypothetical protein